MMNDDLGYLEDMERQMARAAHKALGKHIFCTYTAASAEDALKEAKYIPDLDCTSGTYVYLKGCEDSLSHADSGTKEKRLEHHCRPSGWIRGAVGIVYLPDGQGQLDGGWHIVFWQSKTEWDRSLAIDFCPYCGMKLKGESKRFDHRLSRLLSRLLFKLLLPRWYLRTQGIKLLDEQDITVTITYHRQDELLLTDKRQMLVELDGISAIDRMIFLWFEHGFCESVPKLSPYIPQYLDEKRHYILPENILTVGWCDPILKDYISVDSPYWR